MESVLFIDVDGTLLDSQHHLRQRTVDVLSKVHGQGHHICICSGRCIDGMRHSVLSHLPFPVLASSLNGAYITDEDGSLVEEKAIVPDDAVKISSLLKAHGLRNLYFTGAGWGCDDPYEHEVESTTVKSEGLWLSLDEVISTRPVHKILSIDREGHDGHAFREDAGRMLPGYSIVTSSPIFVEINAPGVSKGHAVEAVTRGLGLPISASIAIGDWDNDISMFRAAGMAVCMANGSPAAKAEADQVIGTNDEDGLAKWLEKDFLPINS